MTKIFRCLIKCANCKESKWFDLPIGTLVREWKEDNTCDNCDRNFKERPPAKDDD